MRVLLALLIPAPLCWAMTADHVVGRIGGLLRQQQGRNTVALRALKAAHESTGTPGATEALDKALTDASDNIKTKVDKHVRDSFADTQTGLDTGIADLNSATTAYDAAIKTLFEKDAATKTCNGQLSTLNLKHAAHVQTIADHEAATKQVCDQAADLAAFIFEKAKSNFVFECDQNVQGQCDANMKAFEDRVGNIVNELKTGVGSHTSEYNQAVDACNEEKAKTPALYEEKEAIEKEMSDKTQECSTLNEERSTSACQSMRDRGTMCAASDDFKAFVAQVNAKGNGHSQPDREDEWQTAHAVKCTIEQFIDSKQLDAAIVKQCHDSADFEKDVGKLDLKESEHDLWKSRRNHCTKGRKYFIIPGLTPPVSVSACRAR